MKTLEQALLLFVESCGGVDDEGHDVGASAGAAEMGDAVVG